MPDTVSAEREPTQHIDRASLYARHEPGRYLEVDAIASRARESADRLKLAFLLAVLVAFLVVVVVFGVLR